MHLEQEVVDMFHASTTMFADALFLYDRDVNDFLLADVRSSTIARLLEVYDGLLQLVSNSNDFSIQDITRASCWSLADCPSQGRLSVNLCLDKKRSVYVNFQVVPLPWEVEKRGVRYLLCALHLSKSKESDAHFIDRDGGKLWKYSTTKKRFEQLDIIPLTELELDFLRLKRLGYEDKIVAELMFKSVDTIAYYKKRICEKMNTKKIEECITFCEQYHIF